MDQQENNRVLMRQGARELSQEEVSSVVGAVNTKTKCTLDPIRGNTDGDLGEC
jgi:hypothetical protein